ncbi:unnamed protein product [Durusdinium trenchii]|uniref:Uncharacterized protein n=1 Tax=Durusdinium trenchii TaxID=1381693 RepID=A0ABP0KIM1_9DINO
MLRAGAPVNTANRATGNTALAEAAKVGSEALYRRIIQYQANVNCSNSRQETPLMLASKAGHDQVVRMLLVAGANAAAEANIKREKESASIPGIKQRRFRRFSLAGLWE